MERFAQARSLCCAGAHPLLNPLPQRALLTRRSLNPHTQNASERSNVPRGDFTALMANFGEIATVGAAARADCDFGTSGSTVP